jgi:hypothetical protein
MGSGTRWQDRRLQRGKGGSSLPTRKFKNPRLVYSRVLFLKNLVHPRYYLSQHGNKSLWNK